ncbi:hypothetical protein [Elizabethkingia miricola]|uniref:hypothetical protein n=1 Tax=Elizabethkingia miricola TaxID=172045 RepID=UPI0038915E39
MENENKHSKSNGIEILENVIKSNENNIASNLENRESNAELKSNIEDFLLAIGQLQLDFGVVKEIHGETLGFYELERIKRAEFLSSIPTQIETVLAKETSEGLQNFGKDVKWKKKFIWSGIGVFVFAVLVFGASIAFATKWYKESIKAKSELRQDILNEIAGDGKRIYNENEITMLQENTKVIQSWIKNNPKKAEDFLRFRDGYEASMKSK